MKEIRETDPCPDSKRHAVFFTVTAWCSLYKDYEDPTMTREYRNALFPVCFMNGCRWDGQVGFIGGFVDPGMGVRDTLSKEGLEEFNMNFDPSVFSHVASHETERMVIRFYQVDMGVLAAKELQALLATAARAPHAGIEGTITLNHLADYGRGKGWPVLRNRSPLATGVGEELDILRARMVASAPPGAWLEAIS